jgi:GDPmannose 4,6-dehydratase
VKAVITGITGQDGSYLAELLLSKGYEVHGFKRRVSVFNTERIEHLLDKVTLHHGDLTDTPSIMRVLSKVRPDEIYHLGAQSHVGVSFEQPEYTAQADAIGTLRILESIKSLDLGARFYNASTSEVFGSSPPPQNESTLMHPRSPYGVSKLYGHWITVNYREAYGLHASNGILFNHESPRRGETFVTQKVVKGLLRVKEGKQGCVKIGNLKARRDWGHAKDYVEAMWLMLQQEKPDDYVISTGESHSVRDFIDSASLLIFGVKSGWGADVGYINGKAVIQVDEEYFRPSEVDHLRGDSSKAKEKLGWVPKTSFNQLVSEMVNGCA